MSEYLRQWAEELKDEAHYNRNERAQKQADELERALDHYERLRTRLKELEGQEPVGEREILEEIDNRDEWEDRATKLAQHIGEYFGVDVGEHSSANCPIEEAHKLLNGEYKLMDSEGGDD